MENKELEEMRRMYHELAMTHELTSILASSLQLEDVLDKTATKIKDIMGVEGCHLLLCQKAKAELKLETYAYFGNVPMPEGVDFTKQGISGLAVKEKRVILVDDAENDPRTINKVVQTVKPKSILSSPIIARDEVLGVITVFTSKATYFFNERHAHFLNSLATQAGFTILNAILFRQMEDMAKTDGLTGLYNHRYFHSALEEKIKEAGSEGSVALLVFDLDNFKQYNDTHGHPAGDKLLKDFSEVLKKLSNPKQDIAARHGGDEFALILQGKNLEQAEEFARMIEEAATNFVFNKTGVSVSIGIATYPETKDKNNLVQKADRSLYRNKKQKKKTIAR